MYEDTVKFYYDADEAPDINLMEHVPQFLDSINENKSTDRKIYGTIKNPTTGKSMYVVVSESGVTIGRSSLCKFWLGNNIRSLTNEDTRDAINYISERLHLPINEADVKVLHYGQNFIMDMEPKYYFRWFLDKKGFREYPFPSRHSPIYETLYYISTKKELIFYEKTPEAKTTGEVIPVKYRNKNILRYELQFLKESSIFKTFNISKLKAKDLYTGKFSAEIQKVFIAEYNEINKLRYCFTNLPKFKTLKEFLISITVAYIREKGFLKLKDWVSILYEKGKLSRANKYRIISWMRNNINRPIGDKIEPIDELDNKINNGDCI